MLSRQLISTTSDFLALQDDWQRLHQHSATASIFTSWLWASQWWQHYGNDHQLFVVVVRDGEKIVGILPTYIQRVRVLRICTMSVLRFIGTGGDTAPDDLDALIDPNGAEAIAQLMVTTLREQQQKWQQLRLSDLPPQSLLRPVLAAVFADQNGTEKIEARISYLTLPSSWDEYLATLHRDRRQQLRNHRRRIEAQDKARFFVWQDHEQIDTVIDALIELHHARWRDSGEHYAFSSKPYIDFHRNMIRQGMKADCIRLYCLEIAGKLVAVYYCYRFRQQVFYFQGGFDPAWAKFGPGKILMGFAIEQSIVEGNQVFDMLRGEYDYKTQWAKERRYTYQFHLFRPSFVTFLYRLRHFWLPELKQKLRRRHNAASSSSVCDSNA